MFTNDLMKMTLIKRPLATLTLWLVMSFVVSPPCEANPVAAAHFKSGLQLSLQNKWPQAEAAYRKAIALEPNNPTYRSYLADALAAQGKFENAQASYAQEEKLKEQGFGSIQTIKNPSDGISSPTDTDSPPTMSQGFPFPGTTSNGTTTTTRRTGDDPFGGMIEIPPGERASSNQTSTKASDDLFEKALELFDVEKWPEAEAAYRRALRSDPKFDEGWKNLGDACYQQNKWSEAEKAYRMAVKLNPQESYHRGQLAMALIKLNRRDEATKEAKEAIRLGLQDHEGFDELGLTVTNATR